MKTKNRLSILLAVSFYMLLLPFNSFSQSVGINATGTAPDNSAILDLSSTNKGFLITRVDTADILFPAFGLMTLTPSDSCLYLYNGSNWKGMGGGGSDCSCNCSDSKIIPPKSSCGSPFTDARDGKTYGKVEIGKQWWMCENLNYKPNSGNSWCYNNSTSNCDKYGRLYDWYTAMDNAPGTNVNPSDVKGVCPAGWHIPSDAEWKEMEMHLGMSQTAADNAGWRGTNEGEQLKALSFGGTNTSGFTGLASGIRSTNGLFYHEGLIGFWCTATESGTYVWRRYIENGQNGVYRNTSPKEFGISVRCVKD